MGSILALFILLFLPIGCMAQGCKVNNTRVEIPENNPVGYVVTTIQTDPGYSMTVSDNIEWFEIKGTQLLLKQSLDYETNTTHDVSLLCERGGTTENNIRVYVTVLNVNDNPPVFKYSTYTFTIPEDTKVNTPIGEAIEAEDLDLDRIFYVLTGPVQEAAFFRLTSINNPVILVNQNLDYEKFNHVQLILTARDTPTVGESPSHTATATININIEDLDNKPPQFLPCQIINGICINVGYTTKVNRSEKETGALVLQPGPLYAIDGDTGINTPIEYLVLAGNDAGIFAVDKFSGNITMTKAADTLGIIFLQIMAAQVNDGQKFATTSLTIDVVERNHHPPKFEKQNYFGTIQVQSATGTSVTDSSSPNRLLQVFAADEDFEDRMNPYITYTIQGTTDFSVSRNGFIKNDAVFNSPTKVAFTVLATDTVTREEDITNVEVEITPSVTTIVTTTTTTRTTAHGPGTTTTTSPGTGTTTSTTHGTGTTTTTSPGTGTTTSTTHGTGTTTTTSPGTGTTTSTTPGTGTTTSKIPGTGTTKITTPGIGKPTTNVPGISSTTSKSPTATNTDKPAGTTHSPAESTVGSGKGYSATDMAALGATLGVILALCLVGLGFLIHKQYGDQIRNRMRKSSGDDFGGSEDRTEQLIDDDDADDDPNPGSSDVMPTSISYDTDGNISKDPLVTDYLVLGASAANLFANENSSNIPNAEKPEEGSDSDDKKEVKSILTKEFKEDPGYKSVWFREDASPEVVVIDGVEEGEVDDGETEEEYNQEDDDDDDDEDDLSPDFLGMNNDSNNFSQL
uniref:Cadherin domain-containing protein n=1 Tax=Xenopus tropicalis TaxID=8364 RepID=A0A803JQJ1_XENTR